jgi:hypothetical protein
VCDVDDAASTLIGRQVTSTGHFDGPVKVEAARQLAAGYELRVRLGTGQLEEVVVPAQKPQKLLSELGEATAATRPADPEVTRLLVESARNRLLDLAGREVHGTQLDLSGTPHCIVLGSGESPDQVRAVLREWL